SASRQIRDTEGRRFAGYFADRCWSCDPHSRKVLDVHSEPHFRRLLSSHILPLLDLCDCVWLVLFVIIG
ncbi:hypothetical protein PENTCL1PPCAC_15641, partial [Pristionchus entomophagus]